jgi:hypothetical protein
MQDVSQQIESLLKEADECELLGGLAVDAQTRRSNRARAATLRELASQARMLRPMRRSSGLNERI